MTWHQACSHNPRVRRALPLTLLAFSACCLSVVQEAATTEGATTSTASTSGSGSGGSSGGTAAGVTGCGATGGASGPLQPGPCGPGTAWVGDTCVVSCSAPVSTSLDGINNVCLLPDGGFGNCADGACLARGDPDNCGGLGLICPPPSSCMADPIGNFCASLVDDKWISFSCGAGTCPETAPDCVPQGGCVSSCGPCSDNQSCLAGDATLGFCCGGACETFGSDPDNCLGCGLGCGVVSPTLCGPADVGAGCNLADGGQGVCCGARCADPAAACGALPICTGTVDGALCGFLDGGDGECCGLRCSDLEDSENCGVCGVSCGPGALCTEGSCKPLLDCAQGGAWVDGSGNCLTDGGAVGSCCGASCVDLTQDPLNCGTCGSACPVGGTCAARPGYPTQCVNDLGQPLLCDDGAQCPAGTACREQACFPFSTTCDGYRTLCALGDGLGFCCGTECTPFGGLGCGETCPSGTIVNSRPGGCIKPNGDPACGPGAVCPAGTFCSSTALACVPVDSCLPSFQTFGPSDCWPGPSTGDQCCGTACVDLSQDPNNCGGCGVVCSTGICISEVAGIGTLWPLCLPAGPTNDCLVSCPAESVCLQGRCINGLGQGISLPFCLAEDGTIGVYCNPGVCANPRDDALNCGSCGNACGPGQACVAGSCTGRPSCGNGREGFFCNLDAGTSYACCPSVGCTDTDTDPNNCGGCRQQCPTGSSCVGGVCT